MKQSTEDLTTKLTDEAKGTRGLKLHRSKCQRVVWKSRPRFEEQGNIQIKKQKVLGRKSKAKAPDDWRGIAAGFSWHRTGGGVGPCAVLQEQRGFKREIHQKETLTVTSAQEFLNLQSNIWS